MKVAVVDYGMGNLHSVLKSVQAAQSLSGKTAEIYLTDRPEDVSAADKIIFPGQGAMPDCMAALRKSGLGEAVADGLENKPFFGICVGAQLLDWAASKAASNASFQTKPMCRATG